MKIDLSNKTALVTGASGNLGRVMVRTLAGCGADVIIHYLNNESKAAELLKEVQNLGRKSMIIKADITNLDSIMNMKNTISQASHFHHLQEYMPP